MKSFCASEPFGIAEAQYLFLLILSSVLAYAVDLTESNVPVIFPADLNCATEGEP